ncbi:InlB B-repeat-containing protein [Marinicella litoralis]|uniref:Bacterial repeat domain-containing protein n=1 Tax=Marinicella litoralis TaxID=644220 RepID=A0A4R6XMG4_9GAMM|nr:hypothetical protein [Marinicella litoralis]TDR19559.1 hypothetical protein C8D91_2116 [Marinicella litoralis]
MKIATVLVLVLSWSHVFSQALTWLSKPQHEMGMVANSDVFDQKVSANGRYLTFVSDAGNLVVGDGNYSDDLFLKDLVSGQILRVSETSNGSEIDTSKIYHFSRASDDGRYVSFTSDADNLPMANGGPIVYLKDLQTGVLVADSVDASGQNVFNVEAYVGALEQSSDGRYLAFTSDANVVNNAAETKNVFRKDRDSGSYLLVSISHQGSAAGGASLEDMSSNGRFITFQSDGQVVPSSPNPGYVTNYLRDMNFGTTVLYHRDTNQVAVTGSYLISAVSNQGTVAFCSFSDDLIANDSNGRSDVFIYEAGIISRISQDVNQGQINDAECEIYYIKRNIEISDDGQYIGFLHASDALTAEDNQGRVQAYWFNRNNNQTTMLSKSGAGMSADQDVVGISMSGDGQRISLLTAANSLPHPSPNYIYQNLYLYNQNVGGLSGVNLAQVAVQHLLADTSKPVMSADMSTILFSSKAPNASGLSEVDDSTHLYSINRNTGEQVLLVKHIKPGSQDLSDNGRYLTFVSDRFQPNSSIEIGVESVFLYDRQTDHFSQIAPGDSPKVNDHGWVVFESTDDSLSPIDDNNTTDIYLYEPVSQNLSLVTQALAGDAANALSYSPDIAGEGVSTWIVFISFADNLIADDDENISDVFMINWQQSPIQRVTENALGEGQNADSYQVAISSNTQTIALASYAQNLTSDVHPYFSLQVYAYDRINNQFTLVTLDQSGDPHNENNFVSHIGLSASGRYISYNTYGYFGNDPDENNLSSVYVYDQLLQTNQRISQFLDGTELPSGSHYGYIQVDETVSPHLMSVVFSNQGDLLNPLPNTQYQQVMLFQQGGPGVDLSMQVSGSGYVSGNLGYFCQANCSNTYDLGTTLNLLAIADDGATFQGWSGDVCQDANPSCEVVMDQAKNMQAIFTSNDVIFKHGFE